MSRAVVKQNSYGLHITIVLLAVVATLVYLKVTGTRDTNASDPANTQDATNDLSSGSATHQNKARRSTRPFVAPRLKRRGEPGGQAVTSVVTGHVLEVDTETPVGDVEITFGRGGTGEEVMTTSNSDGTYTINVSPGIYSVRALAEQVFARSPPQVEVGRLESALTLDIFVEPLALVKGVVVLSDGSSVADAEVFVREDNAIAPDYMKLGVFGGVLSQADGVFEMRVPAGALELRASKDGLHGFTRMADGAKKKAAGDAGIKILLEENTTISGTVLSSSGEPAVEAIVHISVHIPRHKWLHERKHTFTDDNGRFEIQGLRPGKTVLLAEAFGYSESELMTLHTKPGEPVQSVELRINPVRTLSGRVVDGDGRAISGVTVNRLRGPINLRRHRAFTGPKGYFDLSPVNDGPHELLLLKEGFGDTRYNKVLASSKDLVFPMRRSTGLRGIVQYVDGAPVRDFSIKLVHVVGKGDKSKRTQSATRHFANPNGEFEFTALTPGQYEIHVQGRGVKESKQPASVPREGFGSAKISVEKS